jgi:hypothetical protein
MLKYGKGVMANMREEEKPFNDVIDHYHKVEGNASKIYKTDFKKLPKPIRFIGYLIVFGLSLSFLFMIILNIFK